jgi:hypothetical protein
MNLAAAQRNKPLGMIIPLSTEYPFALTQILVTWWQQPAPTVLAQA